MTCVGTANPSTLVRLLALINDKPEIILRNIADGRLPDGERKLVANPRRAEYLSKRLNAAGKLTFSDIWPDLKAVLTWTGGSCGVPLRSLSASLPHDAKIIELGYVASEVQGTVNIDARQNICLPMLLDTLFEFAERENWETGRPNFLSLQDLETGHDYYVFVTTADGLYRYHMNDIVRVTGWVNETPALAFVQKGKGVTASPARNCTRRKCWMRSWRLWPSTRSNRGSSSCSPIRRPLNIRFISRPDRQTIRLGRACPMK